jgi:hypothetical protein
MQNLKSKLNGFVTGLLLAISLTVLAAGVTDLSAVKGTLAASHGGTGNTTGTASSATTAINITGGTQYGVLYQSSSGATSSTSAGTSGYVLTSNGTSAPTFQAATGGSMVYPGEGLPQSTGSAWGTSITLGPGVATAMAAGVTGTGNIMLASSPTITGTLTGSALSFPQASVGKSNGPQNSSFNTSYTTALGDLVYLTSSSTWAKAEANSATTSTSMLGIVLAAGVTSGNPVTVALPGSFVCMAAFPTLTVGSPVYISGATAGAVVVAQPSTSGYVIRVLGFGTTTGCMFFMPSSDWITHV